MRAVQVNNEGRWAFFKQLVKERERLAKRLAPFNDSPLLCSCGFTTQSANVLSLHQRYGSVAVGRAIGCCLCSSFRTFSLTAFASHMKLEHSIIAKVCCRDMFFVGGIVRIQFRHCFLQLVVRGD